MFQTFHDGTTDRAEKIAAVTFDFEDMPSILEAPIPEYNAQRAAYADGFNARIKDSGEEWFGGISNKQDALELVGNGWESGATRSNAISLDLNGTIAAVEAIRRRPRWGEDGETLCVDRALNGDWDTAFLDMPKIRTNGTKIVTLAGSVGGDCMRDKDELFWNGIQLMVTADLLESAGYQTEVWGINLCKQSYGSDGKYTCIAARAKTAGEPMRLDTMASVFAHSGVFRTFFFSAMARAETPVNSGFGSPQMSVANMTAVLKDVHANGWMPAVDVVMGDAYSQKAAIANIKSTLAYVTG